MFYTMTDSRHFVLSHDTARRTASACCMLPEYAGYHVRITPPTRNLEQNARMWASLTDISNQVDWYGKKLSPDDWKNVFTASLKKLEVVPNLDGSGFVALGMSTSKMTVKEMSDMLELIAAFAVERGVRLNDGM